MADNIRNIVTRGAFTDALNVVYQYIQDNAGNPGGGSFSGGMLEGVEGINFTNGQYSLDDKGNMTLASTAEFKIFRNSGKEAITIDRLGIPTFNYGAKFNDRVTVTQIAASTQITSPSIVAEKELIAANSLTVNGTITASKGITFGDGSNCTIDKDGNVTISDRLIIGSKAMPMKISIPESGLIDIYSSVNFHANMNLVGNGELSCNTVIAGAIMTANSAVMTGEYATQLGLQFDDEYYEFAQPSDTVVIGGLFTGEATNLHFVNYGSIWTYGQLGANDLLQISDANLKDIEDEHRTLTLEQIADAPSVSFKWKETDAEQAIAAQPMTMALADEDNAEEEANEKKPQSLLRQAAENLKKNGIKIGASTHTRDTHVGTLAQYWKDVLPEVVREQPNGTLSMNYGAAAMTAVISLAREVKKLKSEIGNLKEGNQ